MNKVLVTGGAGFIGSHICRKLINEFCFDSNTYAEVICLDNLYTGSMDNIKDIIKNPRFKFIEGDITNTYWIKHCKELDGVTHIFNCACPASPVHYQDEHAIDTTLTNVVGTKNLLDLATKNHARIMQFSTSEVYGDPPLHISEQAEGYRGSVNCTGPRACYDEGKRCAESLCFDYNRTYGTDIKVIRIFNTYGPYMNKDDGRVVSNFICQALQNKDITIYGTGSQTRSFCYIDDLIKGIFAVMNSDITGPVNLGNPDERSVGDLAKLILDLIPESTSEIIFKDLPTDDPKHRKPDISFAKNTVQWEPKISIVKGLVYTIRYFKSVLK